jgi:hypothetical protein
VRPALKEPLQTRRASPGQRPSDRLRELAAHVLRLGQRGWSNPETFTIAKEQIAVELRQLARELGR